MAVQWIDFEYLTTTGFTNWNTSVPNVDLAFIPDPGPSNPLSMLILRNDFLRRHICEYSFGQMPPHIRIYLSYGRSFVTCIYFKLPHSAVVFQSQIPSGLFL